MPVGSGYRSTSTTAPARGDAWGIYGLRPGTVDVTAAASPAASPSPPRPARQPRPGQRPAGHLDDQHRGRRRRVRRLGGEPGGGWYGGKTVPADGTAGYGTNVTLNVPVGERLPGLRLLPADRGQRRLGHRSATAPGTFDGRGERLHHRRHRPRRHRQPRPERRPAGHLDDQRRVAAGGSSASGSVSRRRLVRRQDRARRRHQPRLRHERRPSTCRSGAATRSTSATGRRGSGAWGIYGYSAGHVHGRGERLHCHRRHRPPPAATRQPRASSLPVTWTTNSSVATGEFGVWVVSPGGGWYGGKIGGRPRQPASDYDDERHPERAGRQRLPRSTSSTAPAPAAAPGASTGIAPGTVDVSSRLDWFRPRPMSGRWRERRRLSCAVPGPATSAGAGPLLRARHDAWRRRSDAGVDADQDWRSTRAASDARD